MNRELLRKIVDATVTENDEALSAAVKDLMLEKTRERLGYEKPLTEVGNVKITNNDVFVSGKKVGSVNIDDDTSVVEFTDNDGDSKEFDDVSDFHDHLSKVFESTPENSTKVKDSALKRGKNKSNAGDGEKGDYTAHELKGKHSDERMNNPKKHDHGHDDASGKEYRKKSGGDGGALKNKLHKDERMENPKGHDHGHNDDSGVTPKSHSDKSGSNPPDKEHDTKKSVHKDSRMDNPSKHDHGHDTLKTPEVKK